MTDELTELKKISKILILSNAQTLEKELSKYATTEDRKRVWALIDGKILPKEIAIAIGGSRRAVEIFLKGLENAELIECTYGKPPKKIVDFVPASWIDLITIAEPKNEEKISVQPKNNQVDEK